MPIRVLPPETAAKIAAGEVVERPVSVAKELIENSLDAGATHVDVEVKAGGIGLLRVSDNGCGIPADEVETAFGRYATSKIASAEDLEHVVTLGFRGEALASIAAVSELTMLTRPHAELGGTYLRTAEGVVVEKAARGAPPGTSVTVKNLFRNVPARLKFLKSNTAEAGRVATLVSHYALAYPEVRFSLTIDGRNAFASEGNGDARGVLARVYGLETASEMLEVDWREPGGGILLEVRGLTSPPSVSRSSRTYITLFVNRRLVQNRTLAFAVLEAYKGLLMVGRYPLAVLDLRIDPRETDVNVHPSKAEIKFRDEGAAFSAVHRAVQKALSQGSLSRPVRMPSEPASPGDPSPWQAPEVAPPARNGAWPAPASPDTPVRREEPIQGRLAVPILRVVGQMGRTYIVSEGPDGMYLIDQHAAHERVLFDQLRRDRGKGEVQSQALLEPLTVELTPQQDALVQGQVEILWSYGFAIEPFGPRTVLLRAVPAALKAKPPAQALLDLLERLQGDDLKSYDWDDRILATVACHSAVRAGQDLGLREMEQMVRLLESTDNPRTCPHGRPTMLHMTSGQLEKGFGRR